MPYFFIVPVWAFVIVLMSAFTLLAWTVDSMRPWFGVAWRILLWSTVGVLIANLIFGSILMASTTSDISHGGALVKYSFAGLLLLGPFIASALGYLGGQAFGVWRAIRAQGKIASDV
jgi:hypothetical protein